MVDSYTFALAQRMVWVNHLLDDSYSSLWKTIEVAGLVDFHCDVNILWKSYAPESLLTKLKNNQLADSIRTWYIFRAKAVKDLLDFDTEDFSSQEYLWFNRRVRSNSKQFLIIGTGMMWVGLGLKLHMLNFGRGRCLLST